MAIFHTVKCLFCASPLVVDEHILCTFCVFSCTSSEARSSRYCLTCSNIMLTNDTYCGHCLTNPSSLERLYCYSDYSGPLRWLIKQYKYKKKLYLASLLSHMLYTKIKQLNQDDIPDAIIPMPIHWTRHWNRGFNQSHYIANLLSKSADISVIAKGITRIRRTPALEGLNRKQRHSVVKKAFRVSTNLPSHVAIVDDVYTTGASAESLAKILKKHGTQRVDLWVLARTPKN